MMAFTANIKGIKRGKPGKPDPDAWRAIDFMNYQDKPEEKEADLSDEATQAQIDRDIFGV
jgi:hypothetical protein